MKKYIFYKPNNLEIVGMSDSQHALSYPSLETTMPLLELSNLTIINQGGNLTLAFKTGTYTNDEWNEKINS